MTISEGEGESTLAALSRELGEPAYPCPKGFPPRLMRQRRYSEGLVLLAFNPAGAPEQEAVLGPGLHVCVSAVDISKFNRVPRQPDETRKIRYLRGHGRPPAMRGSWLSRWQEITTEGVAVADAAKDDRIRGLLAVLARAIPVEEPTRPSHQ